MVRVLIAVVTQTRTRSTACGRRVLLLLDRTSILIIPSIQHRSTSCRTLHGRLIVVIGWRLCHRVSLIITSSSFLMLEWGVFGWIQFYYYILIPILCIIVVLSLHLLFHPPNLAFSYHSNMFSAPQYYEHHHKRSIAFFIPCIFLP